jgi:cytochrome c-type biogenesis protein CcmH/NrfG
MSAQNEHESHAGHTHGEPFVWDPSAGRRRFARLSIALGLLCVGLGALLWWHGQPPDFAVPREASLARFSAADRSELERLIDAVRASPDAAAHAAALAVFYGQRQCWHEAQACFERADQLDPSRSAWAFGAANAAKERGDIEQARSMTAAMLARFPGDATAKAMAAELERIGR